MTYALACWILIFIWLIFGLWAGGPVSTQGYKGVAGSLLTFLLFVLIGLTIFGKPIHP